MWRFERTSTSTSAPAAATLHLFADSRYLLWVNGTNVLRGPGRFNPKRPEFDSLDLAPYLHSGTNTLVVLVHHYPAINGRIMRHAPGLTALLEAEGKEILRTDASWRCSADTEYRPSPGAWSSIPDVIDGRLRPGDWTGEDFDDASWAAAVAVDGGTWGKLQPRSLPLPVETELTGLKRLPEGEPLLSLLPVELESKSNRPWNYPGGFVGKSFVIDLGRMAMAYASLDLEADAGSVLQLRYALRYQNGQPAETYGVGTTYTARAGRQRFIAADQWCARYVTVTCLSGRVKLLGFKMTERRYPFERVGRFQCSDPLLNRLWDMSVNTIEVTSDDAYGSDARERNEWVQDACKASFNTTRVAEAGPDGRGGLLYSDPRLLRNVLRHAALSQIADGSLLGHLPDRSGSGGLPLRHRGLFLPMGRGLAHLLRGDRRPGIRARNVARAGEADAMVPRSPHRAGAPAGPRIHLVRQSAGLHHLRRRDDQRILLPGVAGWRIARADAGGNPNAAELYAQAAASLFTRVQPAFLERPGRGLPLRLPERPVAGSHRPRTVAGAGSRVWCRRNARPRRGHGFSRTIKTPASFIAVSNPDYDRMIAAQAGLGMPIMYYWAFHELYRMDSAAMDEEAVGEMRRRWKYMVELQQDAGTLSEKFVDANGQGASESCHNYGSVPAYFLSSYVLGVRRDGPVGNKHLLVEPRPGDLTSAEGVVVTEFGPVPVAWSLASGEVRLSCTVPAGVNVTLRMPCPDKVSTVQVSFDGAPVMNPVRDGRHIVLTTAGGEHHVTIRFDGEKTR